MSSLSSSSSSSSKKASYEILADERDSLAFTLKNVDVSVANALRRTMITDIRSVVIDVETSVFEKNNGRLHNEILKERLRCIPVYCSEDMESWAKNHYLEVEVSNSTDDFIYVTTADFRVKRKAKSGEAEAEVTAEQRERVFPKNEFGNYIDFARLGPFIHEKIVPETLHFRADFAVKTARENACYSVVSKCSYGATPDVALAAEEWGRREEILRRDLANNTASIKEDQIQERIAFEKRDFYHLDAQRFFVSRQFNFIVETVGVFSPIDIVIKALITLHNTCVDFRAKLRDVPETMIFLSGGMKDFSNMENSYDVLFYGEESSLGHMLCQRVYEAHSITSSSFSSAKSNDNSNDKSNEDEAPLVEICTFKKFHPHDDYYVLRIKFHEKTNPTQIANILIDHVIAMAEQFKTLYNLFGGSS
jgi:DNA-directed RNA polymerase alpha subunit